MKKLYEKPMMVCDRFTADEYVAACGDTEYGQYIFQCNAPAGTLYYYDKNNNAVRLGSFTPNTSVEHRADVMDDFDNGFIDYNHNGAQDEGEAVIVWRETGNFWGYEYLQDYHATTVLDRNSWEVVKS